MKNIIKKLSAHNSTVINQITVGNRVFTLVKKDNTIRGILDGTEILASSIDRGALEKLPKIVLAVTEDLLNGDNKCVRFKQNKGEDISADLSTKMLCEMNKRKVKVDTTEMRSFLPIYPVYDLKNDIDSKDLFKELPNMLHMVENITQILELAINDALVLTKRKLVGTMWGADKTQLVIDDIRKDILELVKESDRLNLYYELIRKSVERLNVFHKRSDEDSLRVVNNILIPDILNNFENVKRFSSDLFFAMSPLLHVGEVFLKNTTYPAKFFFPSETVEALEDDYKLIIEFLNKVPNIEQEILNPLDLLRYNSKKIG